MTTTLLSVQELIEIEKALIVRRVDKGDLILGAQLGQIIGKQIAPRTLRDLGVLRKLVERELHMWVQPVPDDNNPSDVLYRILAGSATSQETEEQFAPVSGSDLWRFFSNPRLHCTLSVNAQGAIYVGPEGVKPPNQRPLLRMTADEYKSLARGFITQHDDPAIQSALTSTFDQPDFYNAYMEVLRAHGAPDRKLLKLWETMRTEFVAKRLGETLQAAGVDDARIAETVAAARTRKPARTSQTTSPPPGAALAATLKAKSALAADLSVGEPEETARLRKLVHAAVDAMSQSELREFRFPVGLLLDLQRAAQR
jgi:hypothetical protein